MKRVLLTITIILTTICIVNAQEIVEKKYLKNKFGEQTEEKKAKFVELTVKEPDGTLRYETRNVKDNELIRLESYKEGIPVGKWIPLYGKQLDYDFELVYNEAEYDSIIHFDIINNVVKGKIEGAFEAPIFPQSDNNFRKFVSMNLVYPAPCLEDGIQGTVVSQFIIDESGKLIDLSIMKGANKILDKEAARVIIKSPNWIPAKLNGVPVRVHIVMPTVFVLQ